MKPSHCLLPLLAALFTMPAFSQEWKLTYKAESIGWKGDLANNALTDLQATLKTRPKPVVFAEGKGLRVVSISGTRNGVAIAGLWTTLKGPFFLDDVLPAQGILPKLRQKIPLDGLGYVTVDGVQHFLYGSSFKIGKRTFINYYETTQQASYSPDFPWVEFSGGENSVELVQLTTQ